MLRKYTTEYRTCNGTITGGYTIDEVRNIITTLTSNTTTLSNTTTTNPGISTDHPKGTNNATLGNNIDNSATSPSVHTTQNTTMPTNDTITAHMLPQLQAMTPSLQHIEHLPAVTSSNISTLIPGNTSPHLNYTTQECL